MSKPDPPPKEELPVIPEFEQHVRAVGLIAMNWAYLEFYINDAIWQFANVTRQAGACITSQLIGPGPRIRCLAALMGLRKVPTSIIKEFNSLSAEIEAAGRQRNRYLHDMILMDDPGQIARIQITADRILKFEALLLDIKELQELNTEIDRVINQFNSLIVRAIADAPPWPRRQFERSPGIGGLDLRTDTPP